jgi:hypothetical protein
VNGSRIDVVDAETEKRIADYERRYLEAAHAMQSGVATTISALGDNGAGADHKHLRTGINSAMVDSSALAGILISKGVISREEYMKALAEAMEAEKARFESSLSEHFGRKVTLG